MNDYSPRPNVNETAGFIGGLVRQARLAWRLVTDGRVSVWVKLIPVAGLAYLLSPIDLVPDWLPALGQMDDLAIILLSLKLLIELSPPGIVRQHLDDLVGRRRSAEPTVDRAADSTIDASYRVLESKRNGNG